MPKPLNAGNNNGNSGAASARAQGQATLFAIGDVSIAVMESVQESPDGPRYARWLTIAAFMLLLYDATCFIASSALVTAPFVQVFCTPLFSAVIAGLVFWRRQVWKLRSKAWCAAGKASRNALDLLSHETANGANAIRVNLTALREANPSLVAMEHLQQIEGALARIDRAVNRHILREQEMKGRRV